MLSGTGTSGWALKTWAGGGGGAREGGDDGIALDHPVGGSAEAADGVVDLAVLIDEAAADEHAQVADGLLLVAVGHHQRPARTAEGVGGVALSGRDAAHRVGRGAVAGDEGSHVGRAEVVVGGEAGVESSSRVRALVGSGVTSTASLSRKGDRVIRWR